MPKVYPVECGDHSSGVVEFYQFLYEQMERANFTIVAYSYDGCK